MDNIKLAASNWKKKEKPQQKLLIRTTVARLDVFPTTCTVVSQLPVVV